LVEKKEATERVEVKKRSSTAVSWIAIGLGVFMVVVGGLVLLWGLSYQATVGEPVDLEGDETVGSPFLIPAGVASIAFGSLWLYHGLKGFRPREEDLGFKNCPNCGRKIEEDLNFCYHCATTFTKVGDEEEEEEEDSKKDRRTVGPSERDEDGLTKGQRARMLRQEERSKERKRKEEGRARPLEPSGIKP
jgi:hypothetical protein